MKKIRVLIADDHEVVTKGLLAILEEQPDITVVGHLLSAEGLWERAKTMQADVLLLDVKMPNFDVLTALNHRPPSVRVIIVTAQKDPLHVKTAAEKGASGYILKEEAFSTQLADAIREVAAGKMWFSPRASHYAFQQGNGKAEMLGNYLLDVLRLMVSGETPTKIATILGKSEEAIYNAKARIREKLGVETNEQAIVMAIREHLVPLRLE